MQDQTYKIPLTKIVLDHLNPRFPPVDAEAKAITQLVDNEKIYVLAKDIAENGISPIESFALLELENDSYLTLEGNRRICALKLLHKPNLLKGHRDHNKFKKISETFLKSENKITKIEARLFDSREEANIWIERRHSAEDGVGTKEWDASQKARHKRKGSTFRAVTFIEFAQKEGLITPEQAVGAESKVTTLSRYLGTGTLRDNLSIHLTDDSIQTTLNQETLHKLVKKLIEDLLNGEMKAHSKRPHRVNYSLNVANKLSLQDNQNTDSTTYTTQQATPKTDTPKLPGNNIAPNANNQKNGTKSNRYRKKIVSPTFSAKLPTKKIQHIFKELYKLNADEHPHAGIALMRMFYELVAWQYFWVIWNEQMSFGALHNSLKRICDDLEQNKQHPSKILQPLRKAASNEHEIMSPKYINQHIHGDSLMTEDKIKKIWDELEAPIMIVLEEIDKKLNSNT